MKYPFSEVEDRWVKRWEERKIHKTDLNSLKDKIYCLVMFSYPSGSKLHCGHWYNYGPTDTWARFKKLKGFNVFEPMGYDAFGLPAESYAIKTGIHPYDSTMNNIRDIREMLKRMGCMYDWDSELMTCVPEYYKWNQWLFLQLYKRGLAYKKEAPVNWDPVDQTVLANEQVLPDGTAERSGAKVEKRMLSQWFFKITDYADELLEGLDKIDWPEKTKIMQTNWIGKSFGTEAKFTIEGHSDTITVFTTRPDTLFGVTYVVLAPESDLVSKITTAENKAAVEEYIETVKHFSEIERTSTVKEKTGVFTGAYAINPVNNKKVPIWVADYVLASYGTGSVMAVPAHDERDFDFAKKYKLPIVKVILEPGTNENDELNKAYTEVGTMINSGDFNGINSDEGIDKVTDYLIEKGIGSKKVNYRLRDWLISRQRYWGTPIPIVYCDKCGQVPVKEEDLPVVLPYDVEFKPAGGSPLLKNEEFINTTCPHCGGPAKREPDTMDTFVDSSWYYLRYLDPKYSEGMFNTNLANNWTPVDMYVGGAEHATMHLLYARFIHKFLRDINLVNSDEPFAKLIHQGTITNQGAKMSKSRGNVVNPDDYITVYGADVFRMYIMFMGQYDLGGDWNDKGIVGLERFAQRIYDLANNYKNIVKTAKAADIYNISELAEAEKIVYRKINQAINKYEKEIDNFRFNTTIAILMETLNVITDNIKNCGDEIKLYLLQRFITLVSPLAPHLGEECWEILGNETSIFENPVWFTVDTKALIEDNVIIPVQVNGKLRAKVEVAINSSDEEVKKAVYADEKVKQYTDGQTVVKEIYVKNKIYNIVVK